MPTAFAFRMPPKTLDRLACPGIRRGMRIAILFLAGLFPLHLAAKAAAPRELTILVYAAGDEEEVQAPTTWTLQRFERVPGLTDAANVAVVAQRDDNGNDPNYRYQLRYVATPDPKAT